MWLRAEEGIGRKFELMLTQDKKGREEEKGTNCYTQVKTTTRILTKLKGDMN